jgi:hypothetical protein
MARDIREVHPTETDLHGRAPEETRGFVVSGLEEQVATLRSELFVEVEEILGAGRSERVRDGLAHWMPLEDGPIGMNSAMAV